MSPRNSKKKNVPTEAPVADVYVALLFVGLAALITGIVFLVLEVNKYNA
jgi:hypothetical protein